MSDYLIGADISGWQPDTVNDSGLDFIVIKASDGVTSTNPNFGPQVDEARKAGIIVGYYHYAEGNDPKAEAEFFVRAAARQNGELQALDLEGNILSIVPDVVGWSEAFLDRVYELTGNKPGIYINEQILAAHDWSPLVNKNYWLWIAAWSGANYPAIQQWPVWAIWQYADTNQTGGDSDYFNGNKDVLAKYGQNDNASSAPAPAPTPTEAPTPIPAPAPGPAPTPVDTGHYTIVEGDTFSGIAERLGIPLNQLEDINPGLNYDLIFPGQVINISTANIHQTYTVQEGDSLSLIADKFGKSLQDIENANPMPDYNMIYPGENIIIP